jgi:hypothetical protein
VLHWALLSDGAGQSHWYRSCGVGALREEWSVSWHASDDHGVGVGGDALFGVVSACVENWVTVACGGLTLRAVCMWRRVDPFAAGGIFCSDVRRTRRGTCEGEESTVVTWIDEDMSV